jgi:hypothetical protein
LQTYSTQTGNGPSTAQQAKDKTKEQAQQAAGQARSTVRSQVDQRSTEAGERVGGFASDVRSVGDQLREQGKDQPAKLAEQAADRAEKVGTYLKQSDGDTILRDVEDFGRRQPWAVMFGGLAAGFLASRFLKASSTRRYETRPQTSPSYTVRPPATTLGPPQPRTTPTPIRPDGPLGEPSPGPHRPVDPVGGVMPDPVSPPAGQR